MSSPPSILVLSVSELNHRVRELLERSVPLLWVGGEISNFTAAASGHWYFTLKDRGAQVRCVMFRNRNQSLDWRPAEGAQVEARALVTLYEARGDYQLTVENMRHAGLGALFERFERLKQALAAEGLFDESKKRALPAFPRTIGIITSTSGAALHDVLTTLARRHAGIAVIVYPTPVQGAGAAEQIARAIETAGARNECDLLIICRGGGSIEDLWQFNEERVARAVAACPIPIVAGVGHETDTTIVDFVADRRAPTPTAAAELASPSRLDLLRVVEEAASRIGRQFARTSEVRMQRLDDYARRLQHPGERLRLQRQHGTLLADRLRRSMTATLSRQGGALAMLQTRLVVRLPDVPARQASLDAGVRRLAERTSMTLGKRHAALDQLAARLDALSPMRVLERGYSIVTTDAGEVVRDAALLVEGDAVSLQFARGRAGAKITSRD